MPGVGSTRSGVDGQAGFVSQWEDLPEGQWLDNDEHGVHWYLTDDGDHWHSTDEGYCLWVEEDEFPETVENAPSSRTRSRDAQDAEDEPEEEVVSGPVPRLGAGTAVLSMCLALFVIAWTLFISMPTAEDSIASFASETTALSPEIDAAMLDGLESYQTLNMLTLVFGALTLVVGFLSLAKKVPWWAVMAAELSLLTALFAASWTGLSGEQVRWDACDPLVYYCYQMEPASPLFVQSIYPTILSVGVVIFAINHSMKAWADVDSQEDSLGEGQILLFSRTAPRLSGFAALIGLMMSITVAAFTRFFAMPATEDNIDVFGGDLSPIGELFQSVQQFNGLVFTLSVVVIVVSLLTLLKKSPWWVLPASVLPLIVLQFMTIGKSQFNGLNSFEQDAFYSGVCSMLGLIIIGVSAFRTVMDHDWDADDDDDYGGYDGAVGQKRYDFFDDDEVDYEWRSKVTTGVMACVLLVAVAGGFFTVQHTLNATGDTAFQIRDANETLSEERDDLVVIDMLDKTTKYSEETIKISLQINDLEERYECGWKAGGPCTFVYLEVFEDRRLTALESILISESSELCSGGEEPCEITAHISHVRDVEDEDMVSTLETTDLGSYTLTAV